MEAHRRVAKKSTAQHPPPPPPLPPTLSKSERHRRSKQANAKFTASAERFLENFNPETSIREKRKLNRKIHPLSNVRRPPGALFDENGIHIATYSDLCDCLNEECVGCFFECPKCGSQKCGLDCRVHRKFIYDHLEYHGYDIVVKNTVQKG